LLEPGSVDDAVTRLTSPDEEEREANATSG
jgi:hypothetical protein